MDFKENKPSRDSEAEPTLSLEDLLEAESEVLRRVGRDFATPLQAAGHNSTRTGHNSSGTHTSHTSAMREDPLSAPSAGRHHED